MNKFEIPNDPLYEQAKKILQSNPGIGKNKLGAMLGVRAPSSRLRIVRFRGEVEGHSTHAEYQRVRKLKEEHPEWSVQRIAQALGISIDHARLHISRWYGALSYSGSSAPTAPVASSIAGQEREAAAASAAPNPNPSIASAPNIPLDPLYEMAKKILATDPCIGKNKLGKILGVKAPSSRLRIVRYRGETEGHSTDPDYLRVREIKEQHPDWSAATIAQTLGISIDHARLHISRWTGALSYKGGTSTPVAPPAATTEPDTTTKGAELQISGNDDSQAVSYRGSRIRTVEDLLAFSQTDTRVWEVERHVINKWEIGAKDPISGGILTEPLYQLKLWLRRKVVEQKLENLFRQMLEQFKTASAPQLEIEYPSNARGMLEISLMDLHLGKYSWAAETGRSYDPEIAEKMFWDALEDLLHKSSGCRPEKILYVIGNDFLNVDNLNRTTTAGTPQDESMRWQESFLRGRKLMVSAVERLRQVAPVHVLVVPGNHDTQRLWYLGDVLAAWFRQTPGVIVDHTCHPRKYVVFGKNLIAFCHGHAEKHEKLPMLMAVERPQDWAATRFREWHLGHFHSKKTKVFVAHEDLHSVQVRILPSLCPPDAWHASMGYTSKLSAEAYFWDAEDGCVATFTHSPQ